MTRYAVAFGSNLGDRIGHLRAGLEELAAICDVLVVSSVYETEPVGGPEQDTYLNAVSVLETSVDAHELLQELGRIETGRGRVRDTRWGERTLDLDIITSDADPIDDPPELVVPHPRAVERRFVLEPLSEVWPDAPLGGGVTAQEALSETADQEVELLARGWARPARARGRLWVVGQLLLFAGIGVALVLQGSLPVDEPAPVRIVGASLGVLGMVGMIWSAASLGSNVAAVPEPMSGGNMVVSGPYRWARHPMYTSVVLLFLGASVFFDSVVAGLLSFALLGYFGLKSEYEEKQLRIAYPGYGRYRHAVRHRFVPYLF